jgi:diguanylate cyclase (GGDEF)-like protein
MTPELEAHLRSFVNFPTPPGVAAHIIELARDPDIEMGKVAQAVGRDSALTTKILRIANSPLYAQRRKSENLRQALVVLGLNATLTLALSFSLVKSLRGGKPNGVNYPVYWRRALLAGTAARALGEAMRHPLLEELFLAGLLQDIGILALDKAVPDLYRDTSELQKNHRALAEHERKRLQLDHADAGTWLMRIWNLPERICRAIGQSHRIEQRPTESPNDIFDRCVSLSGLMADLFLIDAAHRPVAETAQAAERSLGIGSERFSEVVATIATRIADTEALFEMEILGGVDPETIIEQAREILLVRNLNTLREVNALKTTADNLSSRALELEEETRRDALTGAYNRTFLEQFLAREFKNASRHSWPLSVAFADLDNFKKINDSYGHQAGDRILRATARVLKSNTRESDIVARYGGEEFVLAMPATDAGTARGICERVVTALQLARHDVGPAEVTVTISIGCATHGGDNRFADVEDLINAADQALYTAKLQGRNRSVGFANDSATPLVRFL